MAELAGGKAQIDFLCVEDGCGGVVKFDLMSLAQDDFQVLCPKCHKPYQFDAELRGKLLKLRNLISLLILLLKVMSIALSRILRCFWRQTYWERKCLWMHVASSA